jgi:chitin deacetylase
MDDEEHRKRLLSDPEDRDDYDDSYPPSITASRRAKSQSRWLPLILPRRKGKLLLVLPLVFPFLFAVYYFFNTAETNALPKLDALGLPPLIWTKLTIESPSSIPFLPPVHVAPKLGSDEWRALYPKHQDLGPKPLPQWLERYEAIKTAQPKLWARIHEIPHGTLDRSNGLAQYPENITQNGMLTDKGICSYRRAGCARPFDFEGPSPDLKIFDITHGLPSTWAINFDDGPLPPSASLHSFLDLNAANATHFYIGSNIVKYSNFAVEAFNRGDELSVHTWSHPHMSTLTDVQVLGELGWTMQAIVDVTGKPPQWFRPPYGDIDDRIRIIAKAVFGMIPVMWNGDSVDWSLDQTYASGDFVDPAYPDFTLDRSLAEIRHSIEGPKTVRDSPNAIIIGKLTLSQEGIIILEHELSEDSVKAFATTFPELGKQGWKIGTVDEVVRGMYGRPA